MKKTLLIALGVMMFLTGCATDYVESGTEQLKEGNYTEAITAFDTAIEKEKNVAEAYRGIGMANYELGNFEETKTALDAAIDNGGEATPTLYNLMGVCDMQLEDYASALNNFNMGISLAQNGYSSESESDSEEEQTDYASVLQEMQFNVVVCYEKQLDWESAKTQIASYIAQYPDDAAAAKEAQFLETR